MASGARTLLLVCGLALAAGRAGAAEWSISPEFSTEIDHDSNRVLLADTPGSQSLSAALDLALTRRTEESALTISPHARLRRFTDNVEPSADDYSVAVTMSHSLERAKLQFSADLADESTLTTELAQTGVVNLDASRVTRAASAAWTFLSSESRQFDASVSFQDVDYNGGYSGRLFGYRYGYASIAETFSLSSRWSLTTTGFATDLDSPQRGSTSREHGASLGFQFDFSEYTQVSASLGLSQRDIAGRSDNGTTRNFSWSHHAETGEWRLDYAHSLVPFGTGVLEEQDNLQLVLIKDFSRRLRAVSRLGLTRNRDAGFGFTFDSRTYRNGQAELLWWLGEKWYVGADVGYANAINFGAPRSYGGWTVGLRTTWSPNSRVIGH